MGLVRKKSGSVGELQSLPTQIQALLNQVEKLHLETEALHCTCSHSDCPFRQQTTQLYEIRTSSKKHRDSHLHCTKRQSAPAALGSRQSLSGSPPLLDSSMSNKCGVQRRADGTIIECDGPGTMFRRHQQNGRFNTRHLKVRNLDSWINEDCQVDQENAFNSDNYQFSRQAPERRIVRISPRLHTKREKDSSITRKISLPASPSYRQHQERKRISTSSTLSRYSESVPSLVSSPIRKMFAGTLHEIQRGRLIASA